LAKQPNLFSSIKYEILNTLGLYPILYYPYIWVKPGKAPLILKNQVAFVIEGYPRSGNSFALEAFKFAQNCAVEVASHSHAPAQVKYAVGKGLPTLVLVRNPRDAVLSLVIRQPDKSIRQAIRHYISFYSSIWPCRFSYLVGTFEELNSDFGALIKRINKRYEVDFQPFVNSPENVSKCFAIIEENLRKKTGQEKVDEAMVARPSVARADMKRNLLSKLDDPVYEPLLKKAEKWYQTFIDFRSQTD
jgi:hypothetical protein